MDNYGNEITWTFKDECTNQVLYSGGPYANNIIIDFQRCVTSTALAKRYSFNIYDSYGDGLCCQHGQGSYTVALSDTSYSGAEFGSLAQHYFGSSCTASPTLQPTAPLVAITGRMTDIYRSLNDQYFLAFQGDGNLVLYGPSGAIWWSGTVVAICVSCKVTETW